MKLRGFPLKQLDGLDAILLTQKSRRSKGKARRKLHTFFTGITLAKSSYVIYNIPASHTYILSNFFHTHYTHTHIHTEDYNKYTI